MFKSRFQIAGEALAIAALSASAAAQNPQAPINTLTDLEAALMACWVPPPMEQSRLGMQITVLMSFKRNGELFGQPRIPFQPREASETDPGLGDVTECERHAPWTSGPAFAPRHCFVHVCRARSSTCSGSGKASCARSN